MPVEPFAVRWRRARRKARVWVRRWLKGLAPLCGYLYLCVALTYLIDASVPLGAVALAVGGIPVTWLCGLWVVPRSEDAYILTLSKCLTEWATDVESIRRRRLADGPGYASAILEALPSSVPTELRDKLSIALGRETEDLSPARDGMYTRALAAHELVGVLNATRAGLQRAGDAHEARLGAAIARRKTAIEDAQREFLDALLQEQLCLAKMKPPASLRMQHDAYVQLVGEYGEAVTACNAAIEGEQVEVAEQAAQDMCGRWQAIDDFRQMMARRLVECFGARG